MIEEMDPNEKSGRRNKDQNPQSNTPVLDNFSRDLIKLAEKGKLDPVIGRDQEIARIAQCYLVERKIIQLLLVNLVVVKPQSLRGWQ